MRFGKRLAEVTQNGRSARHYVSYKELKHSLGELSRLLGPLGEKGKQDGGDSSAEEGQAAARRKSTGSTTVPDSAASSVTAPAASCSSSASASASACAQGTGAASLPPEFQARQQDFFNRISADVDQAEMDVKKGVSDLEILVGQWQGDAVQAGLWFTPEQLDELAAQFPFPVQDKQVLLKWVLSLQSPMHLQETRLSLIHKYSGIASSLNGLMQYIEVNFMAVRKILKKFERKVPAEFRMQHARDYRKHHGLFMNSVRALLTTVMQIQRSVFGLAASDRTEAMAQALNEAEQVAQVGQETIAVLSCLQGPGALEELMGTWAQSSKIDVYAKPSVPDQPGGSAPTAAPATASSISLKSGVQDSGITVPVNPASLLQGPYSQQGSAGGTNAANAARGSQGNSTGSGQQSGVGQASSSTAGGARSSASASAGSNQRLAVGVQPSQHSQDNQPQKGGRRRGGQRGSGQRGRGSGTGGQAPTGSSSGGGQGGGKPAGTDQQRAVGQNVGSGTGGVTPPSSVGSGQSGPGDWAAAVMAMQGSSQSHSDASGGYPMGAQGMPYFLPMYVGQAQQSQQGNAVGAQPVGRGTNAGKGGYAPGPQTGTSGNMQMQRVDPGVLAHMMPMFWPMPGGPMSSVSSSV